MNNAAIKLAVFALLLSLIALGSVFLRPASQTGNAPVKKETAFERVMRTRTLRCAYAIYPPHFMIDSKTGEKQGINYELWKAIGKVANLKIEWTEEVGFGSFPENLNSGKEDAFCAGAWMSVPRSQRVEYSAPAYYTPLYVFARDGDTRFDNNLGAIDNSNVTVSVIEGNTQAAVANKSFPKAKKLALPEVSDGSHTILNVVEGKADVVVLDDLVVIDYNKLHPEKKLRKVVSHGPLRTFGFVFGVAKGEWQLRDMINVALAELQGDGTIDRIIAIYAPEPGSILRVAKPYAVPANAEINP